MVAFGIFDRLNFGQRGNALARQRPSDSVPETAAAMAFIRLQLLLYLFILSAGVVVAQVPSTLKFTLFHQLVHSESAQDILPRGVIRYDPVRNSADYTQQSQVIDLSSGKGLYRIGVYDEKKKLLAPAAFTKLVSPP
jgi:hypothetical protein